MSPEHQRYDLSDRIPERPGFDLHKAVRAKPSAMLLRFAAGALTSIASGMVTLLFGARIGGIPLAFPAILFASLTLIEEQEDSEEAREDARGAMAGGAALTIFGLLGAVLFESLGGFALLLAALGWTCTALGLYRLLWWGSEHGGARRAKGRRGGGRGRSQSARPPGRSARREQATQRQ